MISIIVAYDKNKVIGYNGIIPWKIKGEQKRFKELTTGNKVIMGRKTYDEIGHPLPNRVNCVITSRNDIDDKNILIAHSLEEAIELCGGKEENIFIIGGSMIYEQAINISDVLYITEIDINCAGNRYFPEFNKSDFVENEESTITVRGVYYEDIPFMEDCTKIDPTEDYITYKYKTYKRIKTI